jgi:predicted transcriptional regulator
MNKLRYLLFVDTHGPSDHDLEVEAYEAVFDTPDEAMDYYENKYSSEEDALIVSWDDRKFKFLFRRESWYTKDREKYRPKWDYEECDPYDDDK